MAPGVSPTALAGCASATDAAAPTRPDASAALIAADLDPTPKKATKDRGRVFYKGCLKRREPHRCVFLKGRGRPTVVLFGDSEAMQFWPPLLRIARDRGWRLVTRLRAGCGPTDIHFAFKCDRWREKTMRLIASRDRPQLVVVTGGVAYKVIRRGRRLSSRASAKYLRRGYTRTLRRLRRTTGARIAVVKDTPRSQRNIPTCVRRHPRKFSRCDFSPRQKTNRDFDRRAARRVKGAKLIDPTPIVCPNRCPAVFGDTLAYRDDVHFTATFAKTLEPWLRERLPAPARR
ncbi:MAG: SGNH hydrolase domain-containing protein [Thermoleophilaceae bacterium]